MQVRSLALEHDYKADLIAELKQAGIKHAPEDILPIGKTFDRKIRLLG
jgi:hypothetical protein